MKTLSEKQQKQYDIVLEKGIENYDIFKEYQNDFKNLSFDEISGLFLLYTEKTDLDGLEDKINEILLRKRSGESDDFNNELKKMVKEHDDKSIQVFAEMFSLEYLTKEEIIKISSRLTVEVLKYRIDKNN